MSNPMNAPSPVNGTLILVLGILSIVCLPILGPVAMIMGKNAMTTLQQTGDPTNQMGTVNAGRICGIIGTVFLVLGILYWILIIVLGVGGAMTHPHSTVPTTTP